jgi:hypothetical protein
VKPIIVFISSAMLTMFFTMAFGIFTPAWWGTVVLGNLLIFVLAVTHDLSGEEA